MIRFGIFHSILCVLLVCCISCTRVPPTTPGLDHPFKQGTTDNLYKIDSFRPIDLPSIADNFQENNSQNTQTPPFLTDDLIDKVLQVKTAEKGKVAKISSSQSGISIDPNSNISFVNQYYFLDYESVDMETEEQKLLFHLLGDIEDFKGFPNTTYYIVPQLQDNYLILYRIGKKETIPYDEKHLAVQIGDWLATPLVGYALEYCEPKKTVNDDYEETNLYEPKCSSVARQSTKYVRLKEETKAVFIYTPKLDVFPTDFFDGEWYAVNTIVKTSEKNIEEIGHQTFENALLVKFKKTTHGFQAVDASGYQLKEEDRLPSFFIPVDWKEYRIVRDSNILQELEDEEIDLYLDIGRPFFKIKFQELLDSKPVNGNVAHKELKNIFITDNYFSYIVEKRNTEGFIQRVRYALKKAEKNSNYQEKQWYEEDSSQFFPSFVTQRSYYVDSSVYTKEDWGKFYRMTRFDPKTKIIKWYFSKETPAGVREFGRRAVALWNQAFQLAGNGQIQIVLDETVDRELGDIRYNIINFIEAQSESDSGVLGFGPNIYNPVTGEIVSATANIWVTGIVDSYVETIRQYIRFHVYPPDWKLLKDSQGVSKFIYEKIIKLCPQVKNLITEVKGSGQSIDDNHLVQICAWKLARPKLLGVTLHEMGHGFGLRHVFSASADKANYYEDYDEIRELFGDEIIEDVSESYTTPAKYSSVTDYTAHQYPKLTVPGKYDVDAIRFIYFDKVGLVKTDANKEKFLEIPYLDNNEKKQKSIVAYAEEQNKSHLLKRYRVCGGKLPTVNNYHSSEFNADDPMCAKHDYGETPLEVVENFIHDSKNAIMTQTRRYDRVRISPTSAFLYSLDPEKTLLPLLRKWYKILGIFFNESNQTIFHVSSYSSEDINKYEKKLTDMAKQDETEKAKQGETSIFGQYYQIRRPIFKYFQEIFFLPFKHCIYFDKGDQQYEVWPLETIIRRIEGIPSVEEDTTIIDREIVSSCESKAIADWAVREDSAVAGMELFAEVGLIGTQDSYFLQRREEDITDEISVFKPIQSHDGKSQSIWSIILDKLLPVLLEPNFRHNMRYEWVDYISSGIDFNPYVNQRGTLIPRIISHEIDSQLDILYTRMKRYVDLQGAIFRHTRDSNLRREIMDDISCRSYTFSDFHQYMVSVLTDASTSESHLEMPLLLRDRLEKFINDEIYPNLPADFVQSILNHSAVYKVDAKEMICIPENENTFFGQIFEQFNDNKKCINNNYLTPCKDIKDKEAFNLAVARFMSGEIENL